MVLMSADFRMNDKKTWCLISTTNVGDFQGERLV